MSAGIIYSCQIACFFALVCIKSTNIRRRGFVVSLPKREPEILHTLAAATCQDNTSCNVRGFDNIYCDN